MKKTTIETLRRRSTLKKLAAIVVGFAILLSVGIFRAIQIMDDNRMEYALSADATDSSIDEKANQQGFVKAENAYAEKSEDETTAKNEPETMTTTESESTPTSNEPEIETTETQVEVETEAETEPETESETEPEPKYRNSLSSIDRSSNTAERIHAVMDYLTQEQGFTVAAAAAVCGNIAVESAWDPTDSYGEYVGLFQWNTVSYGWFYRIESWADSMGLDPWSFEAQVRAFCECSDKGQVSSERYQELKNCGSVEQATELIAVFYEGCIGGPGSPTEYYRVGTTYQSLGTRKSEAWIAYYMYQNNSWNYTGEKPYCG